MNISTTYENGMLVAFPAGELDEHSAELVRRELDPKIINDNNYSVLVFDLSRLSFMDSTGIGVVIGRYKLARRHNKQVYVRHPSETVDKIFKMSGLYEIIGKIN